MYDLRTQIFRKLQRLDLAFYDRNPVGRLMTRVTSDVETLNELFSSGLVTVFGDLFILFFIVAAMLQMDWQLALVTFSVLPFVAYSAFVFRSRIRSAYRDIRVRLARLNAFLHERFTGIRVVQLFKPGGRPTWSASRTSTTSISDAHLRSITYYALFFPVIQLFTAVALALIIWYGGGALIQGAVTIGVLGGIPRLRAPLFSVRSRTSRRSTTCCRGRWRRPSGSFGCSTGSRRSVDAPVRRWRCQRVRRGEIRFRERVVRVRGTGWSGDGGREGDGGPGGTEREPGGTEREPGDGEPEWVIRDLSFTVAPGEKVAIVGHTGAGKTTIIKPADAVLRTPAGTDHWWTESRSSGSAWRTCANGSGSSCRTSSSSASRWSTT